MESVVTCRYVGISQTRIIALVVSGNEYIDHKCVKKDSWYHTGKRSVPRMFVMVFSLTAIHYRELFLHIISATGEDCKSGQFSVRLTTDKKNLPL